MDQTVAPASRLVGNVLLPPDKSLAHRLALFAALGEGRSVISNFPDAADPRSTLACLRQLGIKIVETAPGRVTVMGAGLHGLRQASSPLDCGNSGTTMRLLAGILAGQPFESTLTGDASLRRRPMERIATPLQQMHAHLSLEDGHAPITITPKCSLQGITYTLPVASAQVKSCILLAGIYADGTTTIIERQPSRDHTERLLGLPVTEKDGLRHIEIRKGHPIPAADRTVPLDFSAAAFFLVAGSIIPGSIIRLPGVGLNPTRSGMIAVLRAMGADIDIRRRQEADGEQTGDITVRHAPLRGIPVDGAMIPCIIDEIPCLAVAAAFAKGRTVIREAAELRVKESDRIHTLVTNLRAFGASVEEFPDGLAITGGQPLTGTTVDSFGDHRIAMAMGIAALGAAGMTTIQRADVADISYPAFWDALRVLRT